jgi:hypothetical protein
VAYNTPQCNKTMMTIDVESLECPYCILYNSSRLCNRRVSEELHQASSSRAGRRQCWRLSGKRLLP